MLVEGGSTGAVGEQWSWGFAERAALSFKLHVESQSHGMQELAGPWCFQPHFTDGETRGPEKVGDS